MSANECRENLCFFSLCKIISILPLVQLINSQALQVSSIHSLISHLIRLVLGTFDQARRFDFLGGQLLYVDVRLWDCCVANSKI